MRSLRRELATSLGNLLLSFFFGFLQSFEPKFSIFCSLLLVFLNALFLQSISLAFVVQNTESNMVLKLGCFGSGLTFSI